MLVVLAGTIVGLVVDPRVITGALAALAAVMVIAAGATLRPGRPPRA